jgi:hypothetical protein
MADPVNDLLSTFGVSYPNAPQPTPALLAFLTGIGANLQTAAEIQRRAVERIGAATSDAMIDIDRSAGRTKQNVTADLVRRGVLSSGEANTRYARAAEDVGVKQRDVQRASTTGQSDAAMAYRQSQDIARQQALDRVIQTEQDQQTAAATAQAQVDAAKQAQDLQTSQNTAFTAATEKSTQDILDFYKNMANQGVAPP